MSKDFKVSLVVLAVVALFVGGVVAQNTLTDGVTLTGDTIPNTEDLTVLQDQSVYPNQNQRNGNVIRWYSFDADGGSVGTISLENGKVVPYVPDNTIIVDGFAQVVTPILPLTVTNQLGVNTSADLLAEGTTLNSAGFKDLIPDGTAANFVQLTNNMPCNLTLSHTNATQGVVFVYLDVVYGQ